MKKIFITLLFIYSFLNSFGQDPNILIGLSSPALGVKIKIPNDYSSGTWTRGFTIANESATPFFGLGAYGGGSNGVTLIERGWIGKGYDESYMNFLANGNVGIGTTAPTEKLDVNGNIIWNGYRAGNTRALSLGYSGGNYGGIGYNVDFTTTTGIFNRPSNDQSSYLEFTHGGFRFYGNSQGVSAQGVNLNGGASNLNLFAAITNQGNFGIGTDIPGEKLQVDGNIKVGPRNAYLLYYGSLSEGFGAASTILGNNVVAGQGNNTIKRNIHPGDNGSFVSLNYYHGITFHTGVNSTLNTEVPMYDSEKMRITQNGDVGIGTNTPREKLSVNGKIRAQEIKVEMANWPDYVFADDYQQQTLPELERYIKVNKHLPEVPSAKEVEQNGVALGEMNKILLKKIEELTLHLIEKDKVLTELTKRIERLEKKD